jgi:hypothetical protein
MEKYGLSGKGKMERLSNLNISDFLAEKGVNETLKPT